MDHLKTSLHQLLLTQRGIENYPISWIADLIDDCVVRIQELFDEQFDEEFDEVDLSDIYVNMSTVTLLNTLLFTSKIDEMRICGNPLRETQKLAILWFQNWLLEKLEQPKIGHIIKPMWQGKTNTAIMLSTLTDRQVVYLSTDNTAISQTITPFNEHFSSWQGDFRATKINPYDYNIDKVAVWIFTEFRKAVKNNAINLDNVSMIFVDEADINGLSKTREAYFQNLAENYGITVIAMSATEVLASGTTLQSVFKDEILHLPIPDSLPELYDMWLTPDIDFHDVILGTSLETTSDSINIGLDDWDADKLVGSDEWIHGIMQYHKKNNSGKTFILGYRNNVFNATNIKIAKHYGINLKSFTGEESIDERKIILQELKSWKIDGIVGSVLVWRGLDIPNCGVVYNSTVTYSPQIFWQLGGRWFRIDPNDADKNTKFVTFLPQDIYVDEWKKVGVSSYPLSSASFFKSGYFEWEGLGENAIFKLRDLSKEDILSVSEFVNQSRDARRLAAYGDNIDLIADIFQLSPELSKRMVKGLTTKSTRALYHIVKKGKRSMWSNMVSQTIWNDDATRRKIKLKKKNFSWKPENYISNKEERELLEQFYMTWKSEYLRNLIDYHLPIFESLAHSFDSDDSYLQEDDLIQIAIEAFTQKVIERDSIGNKARIISYVLEDIFEAVEREFYFSLWDFGYADSDKKYYLNTEVEIKRNMVLIRKTLDDIGISAFDVTLEEIMEQTGIVRKKAKVVLDILKLEYERDIEIESLENPGLDNQVLFKNMEEVVSNVLLTLTPREERVLRLRFFERLTLEELSAHMWFTRERARQIEAKAIGKLRHPSRSKRLQDYMDERLLHELFS